ncbi:hypothetical protein D3Z58_06260, partial [Clostridiaceae bacterium]|nr:hypothetical protein [Clostridiaceae bacterium]
SHQKFCGQFGGNILILICDCSHMRFFPFIIMYFFYLLQELKTKNRPFFFWQASSLYDFDFTSGKLTSYTVTKIRTLGIYQRESPVMIN